MAGFPTHALFRDQWKVGRFRSDPGPRHPQWGGSSRTARRVPHCATNVHKVRCRWRLSNKSDDRGRMLLGLFLIVGPLGAYIYIGLYLLLVKGRQFGIPPPAVF